MFLLCHFFFFFFCCCILICALHGFLHLNFVIHLWKIMLYNPLLSLSLFQSPTVFHVSQSLQLRVPDIHQDAVSDLMLHRQRATVLLPANDRWGVTWHVTAELRIAANLPILILGGHRHHRGHWKYMFKSADFDQDHDSTQKSSTHAPRMAVFMHSEWYSYIQESSTHALRRANLHSIFLKLLQRLPLKE